MAIVRDGEGASRLLELHITGARSEEEALLAARAIATSPLVKTAVAGGDPNWGRIIAAAGRSGAQLDAGRLRLWVGPGDSPDTLIVDEGTEVSAGLKAAGRAFKGDELSIRLDLAVGEAETRFWTTDLTHEYVSINAEYHT
jgi:glutamate N-acetyltransferase/amino-acid N-acetyltransferase